MLLTNGLWELIDPLSGLSSLFPVFWCFEEQLAISSCECFLVVVFVQITLFERSWPCPFVHFLLVCLLVIVFLFSCYCLHHLVWTVLALLNSLRVKQRKAVRPERPTPRPTWEKQIFTSEKCLKIWIKNHNTQGENLFYYKKTFSSCKPKQRQKQISQLPLLVQPLPP